jgi:hypothetical protein
MIACWPANVNEINGKGKALQEDFHARLLQISVSGISQG